MRKKQSPPPPKPLTGMHLARDIVLDMPSLQVAERSIDASLSSESPVTRAFGTEVLLHSEDAINLSRAEQGLPLLWQHEHGTLIGIVERIRTVDGKLRGRLRFSSNSKAAEVFEDIQGGFLRNISIGYSIDSYEEEANSDVVRITRWTPLEASVVTVPADISVGIGRSLTGSLPGGRDMTEETRPEEAGAEQGTTPVVDLRKLKREHTLAKKAGAQEAVVAERSRVRDLDELFGLATRSYLDKDLLMSLRAQAIDDGWSIDQARKVLLEAAFDDSAPLIDYGKLLDNPVEKRSMPVIEPINKRRALGQVQVTTDQVDKFKAGVEHALLVRSGQLDDREAIARAREAGFIGKAMKTLAGDFLRAVNVSTTNLSDEDCVTRAMGYRSASGQTTSDFTNLLANVASKSLLKGWDEAPETWQIWTRRGQLPDFKTAEITGISGFTGLDAVPEDGDITYGKFLDRKETIKLVQYAKKYRLSRQAVINDDLNAFTAVPRAMGRAANRKVGDITYAILNNTGPTLNQDNTALFNTSAHKNYVAANTAPTVATLETATAAMAKQTDPNTGAVLNIIPKYLLVPAALFTTARVLIQSVNDPATTAGTLTPNPFNGRYEVVTDARLDGQTAGDKAWYLLADPNTFDTVEVAFLNGVSEPYMKENPDWAGQGIEYVVGVDFGVSALDYRGIHKYRGS